METKKAERQLLVLESFPDSSRYTEITTTNGNKSAFLIWTRNKAAPLWIRNKTHKLSHIQYLLSSNHCVIFEIFCLRSVFSKSAHLDAKYIVAFIMEVLDLSQINTQKTAGKARTELGGYMFVSSYSRSVRKRIASIFQFEYNNKWKE